MKAVNKNAVKSAVVFAAALWIFSGSLLPLYAEETAPPPAPPSSAAPPKQELADAEGYILQPGDKVSIKIYPNDEYIKNAETEITPDGNVTLALVGKIPISGKTPVEASREIARILDADYLVNPEVVVEVMEYTEKSIVVLGQVKRPGTYQFPAGAKKITLIQAVSLAGGFSDIANIRKIKIMRRGSGQNQIFNANAEAIISGKEQDIDLEPEDVVSVSESLF